ncbi:hypothetical protein [Mongoliitalea lutea]|uniref:Uncharacterized protein n=1 Tax=Mongoliitalea lutea TaxID=849756 RepID=A0A8J3G3X1_9BACT|nr:hypothetical protein [Mongoliitalea lutea]GHB26359.1 hypothetical protein GCM10008106_03780 [Mongoliitalea lutea]
MKTTIFILLVCVSTQVFAQEKLNQKDPKKMSKEEFLVLTHQQDSLTALVNLFFRKRKEAKTGYIASGSMFIIFPIIGASAAVISSSDPTQGLQIAAGIVGYWIMGALTASTVNILKYKRSTLLHLIENHSESTPIPEKFTKKLRPKDFARMNF